MFAWDAYDAPGVDPSLICHYLNVIPSSIPKKQPPRRLSKEYADAVRDEVMKLKKVGAIIEVFLPQMVGKYGGGKKEDREMVSLCRLHRLKQGVPEGLVPVASNRPIGRCDCRPPLNGPPGCFPGLSSDITSFRRSGENGVHNTRRKLPL